MTAERRERRLQLGRRILGQGGGELSSADLLSLVLPGSPGIEHWLATFGNLRGLLRATPVALTGAVQLGPMQAARIKALQQIARRYHTETLTPGTRISGPDDTRQFLLASLGDLPHEVFCCLYLDNRHRVLAFEELFRGTIDGTSVYPREVVRQALQYNAAAVIVAHNHPSGVAEPSRADEDITRRLAQALALMDIRLLDHMVIGDQAIVSLAGRGVLER